MSEIDWDLPYWQIVNYENIVKSWGKQVLAFETTGSYQGDHWALLKNAYNQFGFYRTGYGSCSGCDELDGLFDYSDYTDDHDKMNEAGRQKWSDVVNAHAEGVRWFDTAEEFVSWLESSDRSGSDWFWHDDEFTEQVVPKFKQLAIENA